MAIPEADNTTFTYDGTEKTYNIPEHEAYTVSGNKQTNAGKHTVTVSLKENAVWSDGTTVVKEYDFVIDKGKTDFSNLVVMNGTEETNSFTYGDVITVIFTPQAAKTRTAPAQNQAALFRDGDPITDPVDVGDDGSFTLTYDTAGKKIPIGNQTLTVKYGGSGNLNEGSATVTITLNKKPVTPALSGTTTKEYDGTTAVPNGLSLGLSGVVSGDDVRVTGTLAYDSADVGTGKTITASGITLGGEHKDWYTLSKATATSSGSITRASQKAPEDAPQLSRRNNTTIVLKKAAASPETGADAEYGISYDGGKTWHWQDSTRFGGLKANTTYHFALRYAETEDYEASGISKILAVKTNKTADSNPWTGDSIRMVVTVMLLSLAAIGVWQIIKRKKK